MKRSKFLKTKKIFKKQNEPTSKEIIEMIKNGEFDGVIDQIIEKEAGFKIDKDIARLSTKYKSLPRS